MVTTMTPDWQCCLLCEGSSDTALANALESLLTRITRVDASVEKRADLKGSVIDKLRCIRKYDVDVYDMIFVHRDADNAGYNARLNEITEAVNIVSREVCSSSEKAIPVIPLIPVTMTETWALASLYDTDQYCQDWLKRSASLSTSTLERRQDTKSLLRDLLDAAPGYPSVGNPQSFSRQRYSVLCSLDPKPGSTLASLSSWKALESSLAAAICEYFPWHASFIQSPGSSTSVLGLPK